MEAIPRNVQVICSGVDPRGKMSDRCGRGGVPSGRTAARCGRRTPEETSAVRAVMRSTRARENARRRDHVSRRKRASVLNTTTGSAAVRTGTVFGEFKIQTDASDGHRNVTNTRVPYVITRWHRLSAKLRDDDAAAPFSVTRMQATICVTSVSRLIE